jgi:flagellar FliL protein
MAKKKAAPAEAGEGEEETKKKKKPIIPIVVVVVIGLVAAKMFILKSPPVTAAQAAANKKTADTALYNKCAAANGMKLIDGATADSTGAATDADGNVLQPNDESVTVNLADGAYLKVGIALQLASGIDPTTAKTDGLGDRATDITLKELAKHTMGGLAPPVARNHVQQQLSFDVCRAYLGKVLSVYFTEFVMQASS